MLTLFQKIKIIQAKNNLSDSEIRDCIGSDRYYRLKDGKSDLPYDTMNKLFDLCNATDSEKLWFVSNTDEYPTPKNVVQQLLTPEKKENTARHVTLKTPEKSHGGP